MMRQTRYALFVSLWLCVAPCFAAPDAPAAQIISATFGVFETGKDNALNFEARIIVPHRLQQRYGWVIELKTTKRRVSVREEYLLPPKPQSAADIAAGMVPMERRNQVSQRELVPVDGKIYGEWSVGPNEPAGHRHLQVFVEGELAGDFEFDVR